MKQSALPVAAIVILVMISAAQGQEKPKPSVSTLLYSGNESGVFKILFSGEEIGSEKFQIVQEGQQVKASADIRLSVERNGEKVTFVLHPNLVFNRFFEPTGYEITQEAGPNKTRAEIHFQEGQTQATYENGSEKEQREIALRKDVVILDDNVFHQYIILGKRFDFTKGGVQEFSAFVPQQFIAGGVSVSDQGMDSIRIHDEDLRLKHVLVDTGELQISLWFNDQRQLMKIAVPKSSVEVFRE